MVTFVVAINYNCRHTEKNVGPSRLTVGYKSKSPDLLHFAVPVYSVF